MSIERHLRILARCIIIDVVVVVLAIATQRAAWLWLLPLDVIMIVAG